MKRLFLPDDCARCEGVPTPSGWREGCASCLRRICDPARPSPMGQEVPQAPSSSPYSVFIEPPKLVDGKCPSYWSTSE